MDQPVNLRHHAGSLGSAGAFDGDDDGRPTNDENDDKPTNEEDDEKGCPGRNAQCQ
jgi:hypothetical protein